MYHAKRIIAIGLLSKQFDLPLVIKFSFPFLGFFLTNAIDLHRTTKCILEDLPAIFLHCCPSKDCFSECLSKLKWQRK